MSVELPSSNTNGDPLGEAIVTQGVSQSPLKETSAPISHPIPDQIDRKDEADSSLEDDMVVYPSRQSDESISFGFKDNLLPLSLSSRDDYDYEDEVERNKSNGYGDVEGSHIHSNQSQSTSGTSSSIRRSKRKRLYRDPERRMTLTDGTALTVGLQIGSGIFSSPGVVTFNTNSIGSSLLIWFFSGILAWTGASSFAELGAAIPQNGGAQAYLNYSLGELVSYLFSWTAIIVLKPGSGAIIAIIFGEYLARIIFHSTAASGTTGAAHEQGLEAIPQWSIKLIACVIVTLVSILNALSAKLGTKLQVSTTVLKLGTMIAVPIMAIVFVSQGHMPEASKEAFSSAAGLFANSSTSPSSYALALYSGLWAYDGWDQSSYVAGEMQRVSRDLPRVIHISMTLVVLFFCITVTSYFFVLPIDQVKKTNTIALDYGSAIFGSTGGILFAIIVAFSCFGALNSQIYTSSRLVFAAGKEGYLPSIFGRINSKTVTPVYATLFQCVLVILYILFGSTFTSLVSFYGVCSYTWYFLTIIGLLRLRIKEPNLERPYKTWLITPILFSTISLFLLILPIFSNPLQAFAAFGFMGVGLPAYFVATVNGRRMIGRSRIGRMLGRDRGPTTEQMELDGREDDEEEDEEVMEMLPRQSESGPRYTTMEKGKGRAYDSVDEQHQDEQDEQAEGEHRQDQESRHPS
ncbi:unnamed protein product [Sympodiomycopsis kandeliae]